MVTLILPLSLLAMALIGRIICMVFKVPAPDSKLVKRGLAKPVSKKEPVTPAMILDICNGFAGPNANLSDLRLASICVTAFTAFLRYNELASLRCCDVSFCDSLVKIYV